MGRKNKRKIGVVTVGRSDFGLYESTLKLLFADPFFDVALLPCGSHHSPEYGRTISEIEKKGMTYEKDLEMLLSSDSPQSVGKSIGLGIISFAQKFVTLQPDILLVLGDRYDMICGPVAAMGYTIPVAHIHGGAITEGAIDELVRHAITKMSHIHFVSCQQYADRIIQMGEEKWRVFNVGAPGLDRTLTFNRLTAKEASVRLGLDLDQKTILVAYHPVTLETQQLEEQLNALLTALESTDFQIILTYPNADVGHTIIIDQFLQFSEKYKDRVRLIKNAGTDLFFSLMGLVKAMVGNSSSGISEAASFKLPVVNIGSRQEGKLRAANVIDIGYTSEEIKAGIKLAVSDHFREGIKDLNNPYGNGHAGERIVKVLREIRINDKLLRKKFVDLNDTVT